jgi:hypothetical protein
MKLSFGPCVQMLRKFDQAHEKDDNLMKLMDQMHQKRILVTENPARGNCGVLALAALKDGQPSAYRTNVDEDTDAFRKLIAETRQSVSKAWHSAYYYCLVFSLPAVCRSLSTAFLNLLRVLARSC